MTISDAMIEEFKTYAAATVYEAADRFGDMGAEIRPIIDAPCLVGPAYTVRCWPGDARAFMEAVEAASPGDVIVIDSGAGSHGSTWGGTATIRAIARGIAGVVTNGTVRDVELIRSLGFPVFSGGIALRGGAASHPGWRQVTLSLSGVTVAPGDLVVADVDGVLVVPKPSIGTVLERTRSQKSKEDAAEAKVRAGGSYADVLAGYRGGTAAQ